MGDAPIFLLTDFGHRDVFVGVMKAVMLAQGARGPTVDLTHEIPAQDVLTGALALEDAMPWLPPGSIALCVVDPGVGSARQAIAVRAGEGIFLGPDNGLLTAPLAQHGAEARALPPLSEGVSATFHGRDLFAPAAARLATGALRFSELGAVGAPPIMLSLPQPEVTAEGLSIPVIAVDSFGNAATSLRSRAFLPTGVFLAGTAPLGTLRRTYADVAEGGPVVYWNSAGRLEVAVRNGSAALRYGLGPGARIRFIADPS